MLEILRCCFLWAVGGVVMILLALLISLLGDYDREIEWRRQERERNEHQTR
jgi:hypothetical protein